MKVLRAPLALKILHQQEDYIKLKKEYNVFCRKETKKDIPDKWVFLAGLAVNLFVYGSVASYFLV